MYVVCSSCRTGMVYYWRGKNQSYFTYLHQGIQNCCSSNGQWHHNNQVGEKSKETKDLVSSVAKTCLNDLKWEPICIHLSSYRRWRHIGYIKYMCIIHISGTLICQHLITLITLPTYVSFCQMYRCWQIYCRIANIYTYYL